MKAGFARANINPPLGTAMSGFAARDRAHGCEGIHDDLYVRALYVVQGGGEALIVGLDLLFLSRAEADRFKGAIGRCLGLAPGWILLNTSHTHSGPKMGVWNYDPPADPLYLQALEDAIVQAAVRARDAATEATLWISGGETALPISRRLRQSDGKVIWAPDPEGEVCNALQICLFKNRGGKLISLLFTVACHPSTVCGHQISADYPGVAMDQLDKALQMTGSLFLQGAGGDAKPCVTAVTGDGETPRFRPGTWEDVTAAGTMVAQEVLQALQDGMVPIRPALRTATVETIWPLERPPDRDSLQALLADPQTDRTRRLWAEEQLALLERGYRLRSSVPVTVQALQLSGKLRFIGVEGELVATFGNDIIDYRTDGMTFALGYCNGAQAYLPPDYMLCEEGYEVTSYYEYRLPARFAGGTDHVMQRALRELRDCRIL